MQCGVENCCADAEKKTAVKILYLDVLRVIACLFVIIIHGSVDYATGEVGTANFWVGNFFNSLARPAVPLFVMISGALMLDEQYVITKQKWTGHIKKMTIFYFGWAAIYCAVFKLLWMTVFERMQIQPVHVMDMIGEVINGHVHLWFVPMIIGLYLLQPLLRLWVKKDNMKYVEYFLLLSTFFAVVIPQAMTLLGMASPMIGKATIFKNIGLEHCTGYVVYFVLGWYLNNKDFKCVKRIGLIGAAAFAVTFLGTYILIRIVETNRYILCDYFSITVWLYSSAIFILCREKLKRVKYSDKLLCRGVSFIVKNSLGIYAAHYGLFWVTVRIFYSEYAIVNVPVKVALTFVLSLAATMVMRKIPVLRKLV